MPPITRLEEELSTGLECRSGLADPRPHYLVEWIRWDSGFRGTGLALGDRIVAVAGQAEVRPRSSEEAQKTSYKAIGQYAEYQRWAEIGAADGTPLTLTVERRRAGGVGWDRLEITGTIRANRRYFDQDGDRLDETLGPAGPRTDTADGFSDGWWKSWYTDRLRPLLIKAALAWVGREDTRRILTELDKHQPRVDALAQRYPGPFADTLLADLAALRASLAGAVHTLSAADLAYREAGEARVEALRARARGAWERRLAAAAPDLLPDLPAMDPVRDDRTAVVGKLVKLPEVGNRDWFGEAGRYFLGAPAPNGWCFVDVDSEPSMRMREAARRYMRMVHPNMRACFTILGRIQPNPAMVYTQRTGTMVGFLVEPVAALAGGDAMFIDLETAQDGVSRFDGEEELLRPRVAAPDAAATPAQVMEAWIAALKDGDEAAWRACYADWTAFLLENGRVRLSMYGPGLSSVQWEDARRRILQDVHGVVVAWQGDPRAVTTGEEYDGAPRIQEVEVILDHIGSFDGTYRSFATPFMTRTWRLQRLNDGPWRIADSTGF